MWEDDWEWMQRKNGSKQALILCIEEMIYLYSKPRGTPLHDASVTTSTIKRARMV
jgi:hypothetical protein